MRQTQQNRLRVRVTSRLAPGVELWYNDVMHIISVRAEAWTLPLVAPFVIAARTATEARNVRVTVTTDTGVVGLGASAPVGYVTGESVETVLAALAQAGPSLEGQSLEGHSADAWEPLLRLAAEMLPNAPAARAGLEMALLDAWARGQSRSLWAHFGGALLRLTTDVTIPLVAPAEAARLARAAWADGFRALKLKVGDADGPDADLARLAAVAAMLPDVRLRIDANQAFAPEAAVAFTRKLLATGAAVELLEQPVAREDVDGLRFVRRAVNPLGVPVFADEAVRSIAEAEHLIAADAVDGVNVKLMKSGIGGALEIMTLCRAAGKKLMLGCMLETGLGIAAAAQIAAGTGAFDYLDLDSHRLLRPVPALSGGFAVDGEELVIDSGAGWNVNFL